MQFSNYEKGLRNSRRTHDIIAPTLTDLHKAESRCFVLTTITCNPLLIAPIRAWARGTDHLKTIGDKIATHPQYSYAIGVIEPHLNNASIYTFNPEVYINNDANSEVEVERFFTSKHYVQETPAVAIQEDIDNAKY